MPPSNSSAPEGIAALVAFAPRAWRAKWFGVAAFALGLAGTAVAALSTHRLYRSEAVIAYERGMSGGLDGASSESARQVGARLQDMFASRQRLEGVISEMKLYPKVVNRLGLVDAVDELRAHFKVAIRESSTFRVSFDGDDREVAQQVLTKLVRSVVDEDTNRRKREADDAQRFIDKERKQADDDLREKEAALASFLAKHPQLAGEAAVAMGGTIRAADRERSAVAPTGDIASLELQSANIEEALANADRPAVAGGRPGRTVDPVLAATQARAATDLHAARLDLAEKQSRFTEDHPDVKAARTRLKAAEIAARQADAALTASANAPPGSPEAAATADPGAQARTAALRRALAAVRSQLGASKGRTVRHEPVANPKSMVAVDTEWTELFRAVDDARDRQEKLETKQFQAQLVAKLVSGGQAGGLSVIDPPFRPSRPITGGRAKIALAGASGSLLLALLAMFVAGSLDKRLYDSRDISRVVDPEVEVLVVPRLTEKVG